MAIRVEHQPSGAVVGLAAYMGGRGKARQRQQKYAMDLYRDERRMQGRRQEQFQGFKYREHLERMHQTAMGERDKKLRGWDVEDAATRRSHELADVGQQREWDVEEAEGREVQRSKEARAANLTPIPDYATPEQRKELSQKATGIRDILLSGQWDLNDPETQEKLDKEIESYDETIKHMKPPSRAAAAEGDMVWRDATGQPHDEYAPGRTAYSMSTGKPVLEPTPEAPDPEVEQRDLHRQFEKDKQAEMKSRDRESLDPVTSEFKRDLYDKLQEDVDTKYRKMYGFDEAGEPVGAPGGGEPGVQDMVTTPDGVLTTAPAAGQAAPGAFAQVPDLGRSTRKAKASAEPAQRPEHLSPDSEIVAEGTPSPGPMPTQPRTQIDLISAAAPNYQDERGQRREATQAKRKAEEQKRKELIHARAAATRAARQRRVARKYG